ncbi:hypothetical protein BVG16_14580 [Paenibacillus selenitireducens]|uniref:Regulatory protein RecX n=1 Tax=Paenibacillus selenitireducens TaxID=1324314 RepID=A0A1T2XDE3_9BACL|nr:hypothetical protein BVG16_14580 [Paenibacillus selenitireducens]
MQEGHNDPSRVQRTWEPPADTELLITSVEREPRRAHRYRVYINEELAFSVHEDIMVKFRLVKGMLIEHRDLHSIMVADELQKAYVQAIRFLGSKPRTRHEIEQRLSQKGYEGSLIQQVLERLTHEQLIDDGQYAKQWTDQRVRNHKKGRLMIKHELQQKGIDKSQIAEAMEELDLEAEQESAFQVGYRKWQNTKGERFDRKQKTFAFLMRRGFPSQVVRQVMQRIDQMERDSEEAEYMNEEDDFLLD